MYLESYKDCKLIVVDGKDLLFVSVVVEDEDGFVVFDVEFFIEFFIDGFGEILIIDNGDLIDMMVF